MHITTSTHILSLADDRVYNLRRIGSAGDDSWVDARRGEAFDRNLQVRMEPTVPAPNGSGTTTNGASHLAVYFEKKHIGVIALTNTAQVQRLIELVRFWNEQIGPTDLLTVKTVELVHEWNQLVVKKQFRVNCVTYNCAGLLGDLALSRELWSKLLGDEKAAANEDVIVVGFQETDNLNRSYKANASTLQRCQDRMKAYLFESHSLVTSVQLLGLMTLVFVRNELVPHVSNVTTDTSSTGLLRVWGNKGAVLTRFALFRDEILGGGLEVSVVNCHLSAGEGVTQLGRRRWELREIGSKFGIAQLAPSDDVPEFDSDYDGSTSISSISDEESEISVEGIEIGESGGSRRPSRSEVTETTSPMVSTASMDTVVPSTLSTSSTSTPSTVTTTATTTSVGAGVTRASKYTILMGDMNYRILLPEKEVVKKVKREEWDGLLAHDSLLLERHQYSVLSNFQEPAVRFAPTYKYEIGKNELKGRVPSYTDRILYRTSCPTRVVSYKSVSDLKMSDHRPVALHNAVEAPNCIDPERYQQIVARARKIVDDAENNARPKLSVDPQQITLEGAPFSVQECQLVVRNEGIRAVEWVAANVDTVDSPPPDETSSEPAEESQADTSDAVTVTTDQLKTLSIAPTTSERIPNLISEDSSRELDLNQPYQTHESGRANLSGGLAVVPGSGKVTANSPSAYVKLVAKVPVHAKDNIFVIKNQQPASTNTTTNTNSTATSNEEIIQKYVSVHIAPTKTYLGIDLDAVPQRDGVPAPVWECVGYLWDRKIDDMFIAPAEPSLFMEVLKWLDNDAPLDRQVLDAIDPTLSYPAGVYAVSQVLLTFLKYLPGALLSPEVQRNNTASAAEHRVVAYLIKFINHLQIDDRSLDLWAAVLYDRNDHTAGRMEKRAYLRSMLICA